MKKFKANDNKSEEHEINYRQFNLADVEEEAQTLFLRLVKEYAEQEGLTEQMKAENQMEWVQRMNNIRERVNEVVNTEMIFT